MRRVWVGIGLAILITGLVAGVLGNLQTNVGSIAATQRTAEYTGHGLVFDTDSVSVAWSLAPTNSSSAFNRCSSTSCDSVRTVATGNGSSGSFSTSVSSGATVQIQFTYPVLLGNNVSATIAWTESGFTYLALGGIALSVGGVVRMVVAIRRRYGRPTFQRLGRVRARGDLNPRPPG